MYATPLQKFFTYMGYYTNVFARKFVRGLERLTRPNAVNRAKESFIIIVSIPLALILMFPAIFFYVLAACAGRGRFELIRPKFAVGQAQGNSIKVMSLNACFQDPWSPFSAGIVPPFEPVGDYSSRIRAVVDALSKEDPVVFMGQEFDNLGAQDECIQLMKEKGYLYFLRDLGSNDPVRNHSGLFVASKVPLENIEFIPFLEKDRAGLAKWSNQGALTLIIAMQGTSDDKNFEVKPTESKTDSSGYLCIRLVNVHLNYGKENHGARDRQFAGTLIPLLQRENSVLFGDLNFDTASNSVDLLGFINATEGKMTWTDAGKHILRGKKMGSGSEEGIDALIYNPNQVQVLHSEVKWLQIENQLLSDHAATIATLKVSK